MTQLNLAVTLNNRPKHEPLDEDFKFVETPLTPLKEGEVRLRNKYLSLDPYMRGRMSDAPSYADPVKIGEVMVGATVAQVHESKNEKFKVGQWVLAFGGWQRYFTSNGEGLTPLGDDPKHPSAYLGVSGMPGFTAYMGLLDIGQPKKGETLVVAAATGAVGSIVGQIAKKKGLRVIGVAGGPRKCQYAKDVLGFDECIDHRSEDFETQLKDACPKGIDIYFESVGGKVFDGVLPLLNVGARIPLCGLIANYNNRNSVSSTDRLASLMGTFLIKRIKVQGFIIFDDYGHRFEEFASQMQQWLDSDEIIYKEDIVSGLENTPKAFRGLLGGDNFGKLVIEIN